MTLHPIPDAALAGHTAIVGKTGSGKTSTAKLAIEQVVAESARVCVLDPIKSDWWGLISSADGKLPGLPFYILGGPHGHVPLASSAGAAVAELVAKGSLPLSIIDMAHFEPGGLQRFFNDFAPVLLRKMRGVVHLVIEESHLFAPKERSGIGAETYAIHWAKTLATAGRSKGIRLILATQRTQALHNALLGSCETIIAHRLTAPADQEPVKKWLRANADKVVFEEVSDSLASLKTGTGWLCSGEAAIFQKVAFPRIATFDNTRTPTKDSAPRKVETATVDVEKLRGIIGAAVEEAEASDPKKLKARIAELERAAKPGSTVAPPINPQALAVVEQRGYERGVRAAADYVRDFTLEWTGKVADTKFETADSHPVGAVFADAILGLLGRRTSADNGFQPSAPALLPASPRRHELQGPLPSGQPNGIGAERRILAVLASAYPAGMTEAQWAVAAGMKRAGGTWGTYKSRLRVRGAIEQRGNQWFATDGGLSFVGAEFEPMPQPGLELAEYWIARISGVGPMLRTLAKRYPQQLRRDDLAGEIGMAANGGTFGTYLSRLSAAELIEKTGSMVRASPALMEGPRA